jgi:non-specific serine/threonine protein kinase
MSLERAVTVALAETPSGAAARNRNGGAPAPAEPISAREQEAAALVARGLTNRQIAERLVISVRTVDRHVENLQRMLDLAGRAQIAAWAVERRRTVGDHDEPPRWVATMGSLTDDAPSGTRVASR